MISCFYLQRSCQVYGSFMVMVSVRLIICLIFIHCFQWLHPGNLTSRDKWLPGNVDFPGKLTSQDSWLPGKVDFPGKLTSREIFFSWESWLPGKFDFSGKLTSREIFFLGIVDFPGNLTSQKNWLPRKWYFPGNGFSWFHGYQMLRIFGYYGFLSIKIHRYLDIIDFLGESWLPGKVDFPGKLTSSKTSFLGKFTS